jgi:hypothetical protein
MVIAGAFTPAPVAAGIRAGAGRMDVLWLAGEQLGVGPLEQLGTQAPIEIDAGPSGC